MCRRRRLVTVALSLLALAGIFLLIAQLYLRSERVRAETVARLESLYGGRVRLKRVEIGPTGTTLYDLELFEADAAPGEPPWVRVRRVDADVTAFNLLDGDGTARQLIVSSAEVLLCFDAAGRLLTRLPQPRPGAGPFPAVRFRDGRLTIRQEGRPDLVLCAIDATVHADGEQLVVRGSLRDDHDDAWTVRGEVDRSVGTAALSLQTDRARLTAVRLQALPFVPAGVWEQVQAEGETPVELTLRLGPRSVRYRVVLQPTTARLRVAAISLDAEQVSGRVVIEDGLVQLRDLRGRAAGGQVEASGDLDFRTEPSQLNLTLALHRLDVRQLPAAWDLPELLEGRLSGRFNFRLHAGVIDGDGQGEIAEAALRGLTPPAPVRLLRLRIQPAQDAAPCALAVTAVLEDADLEQLTCRLSGAASVSLAGRLTLHAQLLLPLATLRDRRTYRLDGTAQCPRLEIDGRPVSRLTAALHLEQGALSLTELRGWLDDMPVVGDAVAELVEPYRYPARLDLRHGDLAALHRLVPELRPGLDLEGKFALAAELHGTLKPFTCAASGSGRVSPLRLEEVRIDQADFRWEGDGQGFCIRPLAADLYGGRLTGEIRVPLAAGQAAGAELRFDDLDLSALSRDVPGLPFEVDGRAAGTLRATFGPGAPDLTAQIDLRAEQLRVQGLPGEELRATIRYRRSAVEYRCEGQALGGRFLLHGRLPARGTTGDSSTGGRLRMEEIDLARLGTVLGVGQTLERLGGRAELEVAFRHERPDGLPAGSGRFVLNRLTWDNVEWASGLRGELSVDPQQLRLGNLTGTLGQGLLQGQLCVDFRRPERSWFTLNLQQVEAGRLLAPWPAWAARVQGPVELRLRGTLGREWRADGRLSLARGRVGGVEVADLQAPVDLAFVPRFGRGQFNLREGGAQLALGRATARVSLDWGASTRLEGQLRCFNVDLRTLLRQASELNQVGGGRVSGRIDFGAADLRSFDDLTASIDASFAQTQLLELPVLRQLIPYLVPGQASSPIFSSGNLRAHLNQGVVRIQRLTLTGTLLQLLLEGTITSQGRLDLSVTASNGRSDRSGDFRLPAGPVPLAVLRQATSLLANRLIRLHLGGTVRGPVVQVEPLPLLTEDAARFFLNRP